MNNKGQTLVLFVILIPIILLVFIIILNYGSLSYEKNKVKKNVDYSIKYALDSKKKNAIVEDGVLTNNDLKANIEYILRNNIKDIKSLNILVTDDFIEVNLKSNVNSFVKSIESFKYCSRGYILDNQIKKGEC